ncbi:hypothetical protein G7046_g3276 [Stylonectria norvegica]|nr:hypothetical protein G7046_g3276 [Stylonectria norvegica]
MGCCTSTTRVPGQHDNGFQEMGPRPVDHPRQAYVNYSRKFATLPHSQLMRAHSATENVTTSMGTDAGRHDHIHPPIATIPPIILESPPGIPDTQTSEHTCPPTQTIPSLGFEPSSPALPGAGSAIQDAHGQHGAAPTDADG